jgi:hypothetical protein
MDKRAYEPDHLEKNGIREIAWEGSRIITGRGDIIRGLTGHTHAGDYKAGMGTLPVISEKGRKAYGLEIFDWSKESYSDKRQAVSVAREWVAEAKKVYQGCKPLGGERTPARKSPAAKYGSVNDVGDGQLPPPSRSRR